MSFRAASWKLHSISYIHSKPYRRNKGLPLTHAAQSEKGWGQRVHAIHNISDLKPITQLYPPMRFSIPIGVVISHTWTPSGLMAMKLGQSVSLTDQRGAAQKFNTGTKASTEGYNQHERSINTYVCSVDIVIRGREVLKKNSETASCWDRERKRRCFGS